MSNITEDQVNDVVRANRDKLPWCMAPFIGLFHTFNASSPCCENNATTPCSKRGQPPEEYIHDSFLTNLRKSLLHNDYDSLPTACKVCLSSPTSHSKFYTLWGREEIAETFLKYRDKFDEDGNIDKFPLTHLALGVSNKCNAACRMCFPVTSSSKLKLFEDAGIAAYTQHPDTDITYNGTQTSAPLEPCLDLIDYHSDTLREVVLHGGDPSQTDEFPIILDRLMPYKDKIRINFLSNGTFDKLPDGRLIWDMVKQFERVDVVFSIDSIPEVNEYIRIGIKTKRTLKLALDCKKHLADHPKAYVGIHTTLSNYSICYLPEFLDWIEENTWSKGIWISMNLVNRPIYHAPHNLPPELRAMVLKKLCAYKAPNEHFKMLIDSAKSAIIRYPFSPSNWNTCLWLDKKQDEITGMSFPLFEPYKQNLIDIGSDWDAEYLHNKMLK